jgi:AhpD family alkylhydroperoxidase
MNARLDFLTQPTIATHVKKVAAAGHISDDVLPVTVQELCRLRASQINGCGVCADMHVKEALHAGEDAHRLHLVATWREANCFTEAERAALELTEYGTRMADSTGVPDDVWLNASKHFDDEELAALVFVISVINFYNRLNVITRQPAGDYEVGTWSA